MDKEIDYKVFTESKEGNVTHKNFLAIQEFLKKITKKIDEQDERMKKICDFQMQLNNKIDDVHKSMLMEKFKGSGITQGKS
jgi:hypothetical protein